MALRIKQLREERNLTQKQIADYLSCDQSNYSKFERGIRQIPMRMVIKLVKYFDTSVDYIAGLTDIREPYPTKDVKDEPK